MEFFWLGFMTMAWLITLGGGGYVIWRYVYTPWKIVRADHKAFLDRLASIETDIGRRKALTITDEELARAETRQKVMREMGWNG